MNAHEKIATLPMRKFPYVKKAEGGKTTDKYCIEFEPRIAGVMAPPPLNRYIGLELIGVRRGERSTTFVSIRVDSWLL